MNSTINAGRRLRKVALGVVTAFSLFSMAGKARADCEAVERDLNGDGQADVVILENDALKLTFNKALGGVARSVVRKDTGQELAVTGKEPKHGFFQITLGDITGFGEKWDTRGVRAQVVNVVKNTPAEAVVEVRFKLPANESEPAYGSATLTRTYALRANSTATRCDMTFHNGSDKTLPFAMQVAHQCWVAGESGWYFVPDGFGTRFGFDETSAHSSYPVGSQDPADAWSAFLSAASGTGLVFDFQWKYLDAIENWLSGRSAATIQWAYRRQRVAPGASWRTSYSFFPIVGLDCVDGSGGDVAGGIVTGRLGGAGKASERVAGKHLETFSDFNAVLGAAGAGEEAKIGEPLPVKVQLTAASAKNVTVEYLTRSLPNDWRTVETRSAALTPLKTTQLDFSYTPPGEGTHVLRFVIRENGKELFAMDRPVEVGTSDQVFLAENPSEPRQGEIFIGATIIDPPLPDWNHNLDLSIQTPHLSWAKPWFAGNVGTLFVSRNDNTVAYWRELAQRGDLSLDHVVLATRSGSPYPYTRSTLKRLTEKVGAGNYQTMFFSWLNWDEGFPRFARRQIFGAIRKGKGAVIVADLTADAKRPEKDRAYGDLARFLKTGDELPVTELTHALSSEIEGRRVPKMKPIRLFKVGAGRVAVIEAECRGTYEGLTNALGEWRIAKAPAIPAWEYGMGLMLRAIHWAAKETSPVWLKTIKADEKGVALSVVNTSTQPLKVTISGKAKNHLYETEATFDLTRELAVGENVVRTAWIGSMSDGLHVAELAPRDAEGRSLGWGSAFFNVKKPVSIDVRMERDTSLYRVGETPVAVATLTRADNAPTEAVDVELTATDAWGRSVWRERRSVRLKRGKTEERFELTTLPERRRDILHDLTATVKRHRKVLSAARHVFYMIPERMPLYDDFHVGAWGGITPDPLKCQITARQAINGAGMDYFYSYGYGRGSRELVYRNHGLLLGPPLSARLEIGTYATDDKGEPIKRSVDERTLTWDPPLVPTPEEEAAFRKRYATLAKNYAEWGGVDYLHMDDEREMGGDFDWSERTLDKFRQWLKERYETLDNLNKQWETDFADWKSIMPARRETLEKEGKGDNLSQWLDWRLFTGWAIGHYYVQVPAEAARSGNPNAKVGMHGIYKPTSTIPHDFWQMSKWLEVTGRYNTMEEEWFLSFNPDCVHGQYGGYTIDALTPKHRFHPWRSLLHGGHWCFFYKLWNGGTHLQGLLEGDQSVHAPYATQAEEEWPDLKGGVGKLFIETEFTHDSVAFPYSQASLIVDDQHSGALYNQKSIIQELGLQHWSVPYERLANGYLRDENFKLLILPRTVCLSDAECEAIREFVRHGGVVVADHGAAVRDEHGRRRPGGGGGLDDVFGIDRSAVSGEGGERKITFAKDAPNNLRGRTLTMPIPELGLRLAGGRAWATVEEDGTPVCVENRFGEGRALYCDLDFNGYGSSKGSGAAGEVIVEKRGAKDLVNGVRDVFRAAVDLAGIQRRVTIIDKATGEPLPGGETFYYRNPGDDALYVATMFNVDRSVPVEARFAQPAYLYDVRDQVEFGRADRFDDVLHPGRVQVYAALPYRVEKVDVTLADDVGGTPVFRQGETIAATATVRSEKGKAGTHILRFRLLGPDGEEREAHTANVRADAGTVERVIPLALNQPPGTYRLLVTDVVSRKTRAREFEVVAAKDSPKVR